MEKANVTVDEKKVKVSLKILEIRRVMDLQ